MRCFGLTSIAASRARLLVCVVGGAFLAVPARSDDEEAAVARRIDRLVAQLGAGSFKEREEATRELSELGAKAKAALEQAARTSTDQEVKQRAERLLAELDGTKEEGKPEEGPQVARPEDQDPLQRSHELLREAFGRGMPRVRLNLNLSQDADGNQRVVVVEDGVRCEFTRDKAGAFVVVETRADKSTRHAFKDEAELKAAQPALHERWARLSELSGAGVGPAGDAIRRMMEEQRRLMERLLEGQGIEESFAKLLEAQRRKMDERLRGLDLDEMRRRLTGELGRPFPDRAGLDRALEELGAARTPEELRRAIDLAIGELRRARGEERRADPIEPAPVPAPAVAPMRHGLRLAAPSEVLRAQLGLEGGAVVSAIDFEGPFAASGIAVHDIAIEIAGGKLAGPDALVAALEALGPGQTLAVVVLRRGQQVALELKR